MTQIKLNPIIIYIGITIFSILASAIAFFFQFKYHELPCPLCLLQRFGFLAIGFGAYLSMIRGASWKYDLIIICASTYTLLVALRQVLLHIVPNDPGYGSSFLGIHFYTWSLLSSFIFIILIAILPLINFTINMFNKEIYFSNLLVKLIKVSFIIIILINIVATYLECGFTQCPDNPINYLELQK